MAIAVGPTREERIKREFNRLKRLLKELPKEKLQAAEGMIERAAFMAITLKELEEDINWKGTVEMFTQGEMTYERKRPAVEIYNTTMKNYAAACKQLTDLIPGGVPKPEGQDAFQVIMGRK
ncbi:P27 family phage terminase small subunit [Paenibacillus whitsoniae]|uniref:P27 family phage terminase small subunit n=1 Tax=Paenibacillus whitsoniae TaxID=2496558 RepID=A0A3S0ALH0_9BACL|nr:P27 family phage terminase small subunit [Paenibacillus whitsoniae]RTE05499.1 hypothetical protein EJQ19_25085 [Paenibacillus whitsoniae]